MKKTSSNKMEPIARIMKPIKPEGPTKTKYPKHFLEENGGDFVGHLIYQTGTMYCGPFIEVNHSKQVYPRLLGKYLYELERLCKPPPPPPLKMTRGA